MAAACNAGITVPAASLKAEWEALVADAVREATLTLPAAAGMLPRTAHR